MVSQNTGPAGVPFDLLSKELNGLFVHVLAVVQVQ